MLDFQRRKLFAAEAAIWHHPANPTLDDDATLALVDEVVTTRGARLVEAALTPAGRAGPIADKLALPPWSRRPLLVLHELQHHLTDPMFPPHGAEFCAGLLDLCETFASPALAEALRGELLVRRLHFDPDTRRRRVRRTVVDIVNRAGNWRGQEDIHAELILDDPPAVVTGVIGGLDGETLEVGDEYIDLARARYISTVGDA